MWLSFWFLNNKEFLEQPVSNALLKHNLLLRSSLEFGVLTWRLCLCMASRLRITMTLAVQLLERNKLWQQALSFSDISWGSSVSLVTGQGLYVLYFEMLQARWRSWLWHCAASSKVAYSIPDGATGIFHWHNPSGRTMSPGSPQLLTEMSTRNISWG
jgi:hypothetical protein